MYLKRSVITFCGMHAQNVLNPANNPSQVPVTDSFSGLDSQKTINMVTTAMTMVLIKSTFAILLPSRNRFRKRFSYEVAVSYLCPRQRSLAYTRTRFLPISSISIRFYKIIDMRLQLGKHLGNICVLFNFSLQAVNMCIS